MKLKLITSCLLLTLSVGCSITGPKPGEDPAYAPTYPQPADLGKYSSNGAIYNNQTSMSLFETPRARRVGDILTVKLVEKTVARKGADNTSDKDTTVAMDNPNVLGQASSLVGKYNLGFNIEAKRKFKAESTANQNNDLTGDISVTVHKVLANGNMIIQGEKWININTGNEYIRLSGIVRPQDIKPDNTIDSTKVANARIAYSGKGQGHDGQVMGWLGKILWSAVFPF